MAMMVVKCKYCGAKNNKETDQYQVKCSNCGKVTTYFVQTKR